MKDLVKGKKKNNKIPNDEYRMTDKKNKEKHEHDKVFVSVEKMECKSLLLHF
jgi:hypothetical protein